ncbi:hypothetical protein K493DRAFT_320508 [Basidiobolus meristosporus CBS 931.73]|uniref:INSIG-domain-containing protein n=1 Tax=Basidiobolus meristosporus CBS 931.73 TaxID=1314790 RepID=A0A1Y1X8S5_9FUNG|nr:hypothetical protein K493DRAFT_320508 [Basidiobolus meristosporus CBS 931.73]|eukprot:ORX82160.1 hypothetical protein K493DRAFT_320508 [Basidiobolus meristosporus CBS 931.73]
MTIRPTVGNHDRVFNRTIPMTLVDSAYTCYLHTSSFYYIIRALILFLIGFTLALINDQLDVQQNITQYPDPVTRLIVSGRTAVLSGFLAVGLAIAYSWLDMYYSGKPHIFYEDWTNSIRSLGGFLGLHLVASKISIPDTAELTGVFTLVAFGLWFFLDSTVHGFLIALLSTAIGTLGVYHFTQPDFYGLRVATPCLVYSSCICFGTLGRQIAIIPREWYAHAPRHE